MPAQDPELHTGATGVTARFVFPQPPCQQYLTLQIQRLFKHPTPTATNTTTMQTQPKKPRGLSEEGNKHDAVRSINSFTALPRQSDRKHSLITTQIDPGPPPAANRFIF